MNKQKHRLSFLYKFNLRICTYIYLLIAGLVLSANPAKAETRLDEMHPANGWILRKAQYALTLEAKDGVLLECLTSGEPKLNNIFRPVGPAYPNPNHNYYVNCDIYDRTVRDSSQQSPQLNQLRLANFALFQYRLKLPSEVGVLVLCKKGEPRINRVFQKLADGNLASQPYDYIRCGEWHSF